MSKSGSQRLCSDNTYLGRLLRSGQHGCRQQREAGLNEYLVDRWSHSPQLALSRSMQSSSVRRRSEEEQSWLTWGSRAQNTGVALRRVRTRAKPILFFASMDFSKALNVLLLPEYACTPNVRDQDPLCYNYIVPAHPGKWIESVWRCPQILVHPCPWNQEAVFLVTVCIKTGQSPKFCEPYQVLALVSEMIELLLPYRMATKDEQ